MPKFVEKGSVKVRARFRVAMAGEVVGHGERETKRQYI